MKDDTSTPTPEGSSPNEFERGMPGTQARDDAEAAIQQLRQRGGIFVEAVRATRMPMALTDPNLPGNPIVFANEAFVKLSGYRMDEVLGQQPHFMNGPGTDPNDVARFAEAIRSDQDDVIESVQYRKNGSRFVATVLISAFKDGNGRTLNHFLSYLDVTRRVEAEAEVAELKALHRALHVSEAKYRGLLNSIDEGFCIIEVLFDDAGRPTDYIFLETNSSFERQTGIEDAVGRRMREIAPAHEQHWFDIYGRIARTGEPERFEQPAEALGRYYDVYAFRVEDHAKNQVGILFNDISERKRAQRAARESEERHAFLLKLTDALRPISDASEIQRTTAKMVAEHLGADRAMYAEVEGEPGSESGTLRGQYVRDGAAEAPVAPFPEHYTYGQFGQHTMAARYRGEPLVVADVQTNSAYSAEERAAWAQFNVRAAIVATLPKGCRLVAEFGVHSTSAREWTESEIALVKEVAERTWAAAQRARAETALRESEEKYRSLFETIDSGYALTENVRDDEGRVVDLFGVDFNRSYTQHSGLPPFADRRASEVITVEPEWLRQFEEVARTGLPARYENYIPESDRWVSTHYSLVGDLGSDRVAVVFDDITDRKRAEAALRESEERQAFQLRLSDAIRPLSDPVEVVTVACELLGHHLGVGRCGYGEVDDTDEFFIVERDWTDGTMPSFKGEHLLVSFGPEFTAAYRAGESVRIDDALADARAAGAEAAFEAAGGVRASLGIPLIKEGRFAAGLFVQQMEPRHWTDQDEALAREVVERTWASVQRARAEADLRESEEKYRSLFESMDEAYAVVDVLKDEAGNWADFRFIQVNPAFMQHTTMPYPVGKTATELLGAPNPRWVELYGQALDTGQPLRVEESEGTLGLTFDLNIFALDQGHNRVAVLFTNITDRKRSQEALIQSERHATLLLAELQHRVRNTLSIIRSIARRTAETTDTSEEMLAHFQGRLDSFSRVQSALTRNPDATVDLASLIEDELVAHAAREGEQVRIDGPSVLLQPKMAERLSLAIHELTTNAVKHGALLTEKGRISVSWEVRRDKGREELVLRWRESGLDLAEEPITREGFGMELLRRSLPYDVEGCTKVEFRPQGLAFEMVVPLPKAA